MASDLRVRGMRGIAEYYSTNVGKCQTPFLHGGLESTPHCPHPPRASGPAPVTVETIVHLLEDGLDFALSLGDAEAAVDAIMGMAAVQGLAADRIEVATAVADELRKLEK